MTSSRKADAPATFMDHNSRWHLRKLLSGVLRGGRMTKVKGVAASYAPQLGELCPGAGAGGFAAMLGALGGSVSAIALGTAFAAAPAMAGDCVDTAGTFVCSGPADPAADTTQNLDPAGALVVVTDPDFGIDTSTNGGDAFTLGDNVNTTSINFQDTNEASITGADSGIFANNPDAASTDLTIVTSGVVEGLNGQGITAINQGTGATTVTSINAAGNASVTGNFGYGISGLTGPNATTQTITVNNVTSTTDAGIRSIHAGTGNLSIASRNAAGNASVSGGAHGILARNSGSGGTFVTANNVDSMENAGIDVRNEASAGAISISATGTVQSTGSNGILAEQFGGGNLRITSYSPGYSAQIIGAQSGVVARNSGNLATVLSLDSVSGNTGAGVDATNSATTTALTIRARGTVSSSASNGVNATHAGSGDLDVSVANAYGNAQVIANQTGINVDNNGTGVTSVTANSVTATDGDAIYVNSAASTTSLSVTTTGTVRSTNEDGIEASHDGTGNLTFTATNADGDALVSGGSSGIYARNRGTGSAYITVNNASGGAGAGIVGTTSATSGALTITADGTVQSNSGNGIGAIHFGSGDLSITNANAVGDAQVMGGAYGVFARNGGSGATVLELNSVSGGAGSAVYADNLGATTGLTITANGTIESTQGDGIEARHSGSGDLGVSVANAYGNAQVIANQTGIKVDNNGTGATSVTADNVTATDGDAIYVNSGASTTSLSVTTTGTVQSTNGNGIDARHYGSGDLTITATNAAGDALVSGGDDGIFAYGDTLSGAMTISANNVRSSNEVGIAALHYGSDGLTVDVTNADGTGDVTAAKTGIFASNSNGGAVQVTANNVTSTTGAGISASNNGDGTSLTVTANGTVRSDGFYGITASHDGTGDLTINATNADGMASVSGANGGIRADNENGGAIIITANNVDGGSGDAIRAENDAAGTGLSITTSGTVQTTSGYAIEATHSGSGDLTIAATNADSTAQVNGFDRGISAGNTGTGATSITVNTVTAVGDAINVDGGANTTGLVIAVTGNVLSSGADAIDAGHEGSGDLTITATNANSDAQVTGDFRGILALNNGSDALRITANNVSGTDGQAIGAYGAAGTTDLSITVDGLVRSENNDAIFTRLYGSGDLTITATNTAGEAQITGGGSGVYALNAGSGAASVTVDNVTAANGNGIFVDNEASATSLSVTAKGTVQATTGAGIFAENDGTGDLTINATNAEGDASVSGTTYGIFAEHTGSGATVVTANSVTGTVIDGIRVEGDSSTTSASVTTTGNVYGGRNGIIVDSNGSGDLTINASNSAGTGVVRGGENGVVALNGGTGSTNVTVDNAYGGSGDGIQASNISEFATDLTVTANGTVTGSDYGITTFNGGSGDLTITASNSAGTAQVTGGDDEGIQAGNANGGAISITADNVSSTNGNAIEATNDSAGTGLSITTSGTVRSAQAAGIDADHDGSGDLIINATNAAGTAQVTGDTYGIFAAADTLANALTITANNVSSVSGNGVFAANYGSGDVTIDITNDAGTGQVTAANVGIFTRNNNGGVLTVTANNVSSTNSAAIDVINDTAGTSLSVTTSGFVRSDGSDGIRAEQAGSGDLAISATNSDGSARIIAQEYGVAAINTGTGSTQIEVDRVDAYNQQAIRVENGANTDALSIQVNNRVASAFGTGIYASHEGSGDARITGATASSVGGANVGLDVRNSGNGATIIDVNDVSGRDDAAIFVRGGATTTDLSITTSGTVRSTSGDGIRADHAGTGDLTINATNADGTAQVTAYGYGIRARHTGSGAIAITADNVTATDEDAIFANGGASTTSLTVTASGAIVSTNEDGIDARHSGSGDLIVAASTAEVTGGERGIYASNIGTGATSVSANTVSGRDDDGLYVRGGSNTTDLSITVTGNVQSTLQDGIDALHDGSGDLTITASNAAGTSQITAGNRGIYAVNTGDGSTSITANNITATNRDGVYALGGGSTTDLTISVSGNVQSSGEDGIEARHVGTGDLTITAANTASDAQVTGNNRGIAVFNVRGGATSITANNVSSTNGQAIQAYNYANAGDLSITVDGVVESAAAAGIFANQGGTGDLAITAANAAGDASVSGTTNGIFASGLTGSGAMSVTANNVTATNGSGILAAHEGSGGLIVSATNSAGTAQIVGTTSGILARNSNGGALSITANNVQAGGGAAVSGRNDSAGTELSITVDGTVRGDGRFGIQAENEGSGDLTVIASNAAGTSSVTGSEYGIFADNENGGALSVTANNVYSTSESAIFARNDAAGTGLSVTTSGTVQSTQGNGLQAFNYGSGDLTVDAANAAGTGQVTGATNGVVARNNNGGAVRVTANNVTTSGGDGIAAANSVDGSDLSITIDGTVQSRGNFGIYAYNEGTGDLTVIASNAEGTASVTGDFGGIRADNRFGGALTVTADNVSGNAFAAISVNGGPGTTQLTLTTSGIVRSAQDNGIRATHSGTGDLTINSMNSSGTAQVIGDVYGISARNTGMGSTSISVNNVNSNLDRAIFADNISTTQDLSIMADGTVTSQAEDGIFARNQGSGDLTITSSNAEGTALVSGYQSGISADNRNGGALSITANSVYGEDNIAIYAVNDAAGTTLSVTTSGVIRATRRTSIIPDTTRDGIRALHYGSGDLTVTATNAAGTARVDGYDDGIYTLNEGSASTTIIANNASGVSNRGIYAINGVNTTGLSITADGTVSSVNYDGLLARNYGAGDLTITSSNAQGTAQVSGLLAGLGALNYAGGALRITANNVSGGILGGIVAFNAAGTTDLSITVDGAVSVMDISDPTAPPGIRSGIVANNLGSGDLTIVASNASGTAQIDAPDTGIFAANFSGGALDITADNVSGTSDYGIYAENLVGGTSLSVASQGAISGGSIGVYAANYGTGDLNISSTNADGTAQVSGGDDGIRATNENGGALGITVDNVTATGNDAINASNDASGTGLSIVTTGTVIGEDEGIDASHSGTGPLSVTVSGVTTGTTDTGILATTGAGGLSVITLDAGANVSGGEYAIVNRAGDSTTSFNTGSTISGVTRLGLGSDNVTIAGGDISGVTVLDGGDDSDTSDGFVDVLTFSGFAGSVGADLQNWEEIVFDNTQATFTGASITSGLTQLRNGTTFSAAQPGFALSSALSIDGSSTFFTGFGGAGNVMINGDVANTGTISSVDNAAGDQLIINGNLTGMGNLAFDVDVSTATADTISIAGDTVGSGFISVNGFGLTIDPAEIALVDVSGTTSTGAFGLTSTNFTLPDGQDAQIIGAFGYQLRFDAQNQTFLLSPFAEDGTLLLNPATIPFEAYPAQLTRLNTPGTTLQTWGNRPSVQDEASEGKGRKSVGQSLIDFELTLDKALWISFAGTRAEHDERSTLGSEVDTDVFGFEIGLDIPVFESDASRLILGTSFAWQDADTDIDGLVALAGGIDTQAASFTLSALWLSSSQFYANGQMRYSTFSSDFSVDGLGRFAPDTNGDGMAVSMEVGKVFDLSDGLTLVPQVQFTHSAVSSDGIADPFGSPFIAFVSDGETTSARAGLMAEHVTGGTSLIGSVSYIHAFDNDTSIDFAGTPFITSLAQNRVELTAGAHASVAKNLVFHGALTAQGAISDFSNDNSYGVTGGVRFNF
ncbi:MAG: hypothetical protein AAF732_11555 [Pseudomonadota bacterium]